MMMMMMISDADSLILITDKGIAEDILTTTLV
jgi:hypothetical protein